MVKYIVKYISLLMLFVGSLHSHTPSLVYNSVNVITGEYCETECDLSLNGSYPLTIQRTFNSSQPLSHWQFNHPNIFENNPDLFDGTLYSTSLVLYEYDSFKRLTSIKVSDLNGHETFHELQIEYDGALLNPSCTIKAPTGESVKYLFRSAGAFPHAPPFILDKVIGTDQQMVTYQYCDHPKDHRKLVCRKESTNGEFLITEYDQEGRVTCQLAPLGSDQTPVVKHRFTYQQNCTVVKDALGHEVAYYHNKTHLTAIDHYESGKVLRSEKFFWDEKATPPALIAKATYGNTSEVEYGETYDYDAHGNIIETCFYGHLTGKEKFPILIDSKGRPQGNVERHTITCTYQKDAPHLLLSKTEGGITTRYQYKEFATLPCAKFVEANNEIKIRHFFSYDLNNLLIKTTIDDGITYDPSNLLGVTERHITVYNLRDSSPARGSPETIEERYLDIPSGKEVLLKKLHNHYSQKGELILQEIYNCHNEKIASESYLYDSLGREIKIRTRTGEIIEKSYDARNNVTAISQINEKGEQKSLTNAYDYFNRLIRCDEVLENGQILTHSYQYDYTGNRTSETDTCGNTTRYEYDPSGQLIRIRYPEVLDPQGSLIQPVEEMRYDSFGNVVETIDANRNSIRTKYNSRSKPIEVLYPDGSKETFEYNQAGSVVNNLLRDGTSKRYETDFLARIIRTTRLDSKKSLHDDLTKKYTTFHLKETYEPSGNQTFYEYEYSGKCHSRLIVESNGTCHRNEYNYDLEGGIDQEKCWFGTNENEYSLLEKQKDPLGKILQKQLKDSAGNTLKQAIPSQSTKDKNQYNHHFQNSRGQYVLQITSVDTKGSIISTTLDALGRVERIEKHNGLGLLIAQQEMRYDPVGNKTSEVHTILIGGKPIRTYTLLWEYDSLNRIIATVDAAGSLQQAKTHYRYNAIGKLKSLTKADGTILNYTYDSLARLESVKSSDHTIHYQYRYDQNDNVISVEDLILNNVTKRSYNGDKQVLEELLANQLKISKKYDAQGRVLSLNLPDGSRLSYEYNAAYLIAAHRFSKQGKLKYSHKYAQRSLSGKILKAILPSKIGEITYEYDAENRLKALLSPWFSQHVLEYDDQNNLTSIATQDRSGSFQNHYTYDDRQQLIQEEGITYAYDSLFNRISESDQSFNLNERNQVLEAKGFRYQYNENGCLIEKSSGSLATKYSYDALNRLIQVLMDDKSIHYTYDAFNRRLSKTVLKDGKRQTVNYLYDGFHEIGALLPDQTFIEFRLLGEGAGAEMGTTVAIELQEKLYIPLNDIQGSICQLIDALTGESVESQRYTAFGMMQGVAEGISNPWGFSGKRLDTDTGLISFGQRDYDPSIGRWTTMDPLGYVDGPNQYAYVANNPLNFHDQWGHFAFCNIWDNFYQELVNFYDIVIHLKSFKNRNFKKEMTGPAEAFLGGNFLYISGFYEGELISGVFGKGEINDKVRITALNGVLNLHEHWMSSIEAFSKTHGGVNIHYIFSPSKGWTGDAVNGLLAKFGFAIPATKLLANKWKHLIQEMGGPGGGGIIYHYAHSMGGTNTNVARDFLTPEEQKMIKVITIGSPTMIAEGGFGSVVNYVSQRDFVGIFDPITYFSSFFKKSNIVHLGSGGIPLVDHLLSMETYAKLIELLGQQFQEAHGSLD